VTFIDAAYLKTFQFSCAFFIFFQIFSSSDLISLRKFSILVISQNLFGNKGETLISSIFILNQEDLHSIINFLATSSQLRSSHGFGSVYQSL